MKKCCFLLDGPIMTAPERRQAVTAKMAKDIADTQALLDESETRRFLYALGYPMLDIELLAPDARALAFQEIVAREMSRP